VVRPIQRLVPHAIRSRVGSSSIERVSESVSKLWIDEECATVVEIVVDIFIHSFTHARASELR